MEEIVQIILLLFLPLAGTNSPPIHKDVCVAQVYVDSEGFTNKRQVCGDWTAD